MGRFAPENLVPSHYAQHPVTTGHKQLRRVPHGLGGTSTRWCLRMGWTLLSPGSEPATLIVLFFSLSLFESGEYMWLGIYVVCVSVDVWVFRLSLFLFNFCVDAKLWLIIINIQNKITNFEITGNFLLNLRLIAIFCIFLT